MQLYTAERYKKFYLFREQNFRGNDLNSWRFLRNERPFNAANTLKKTHR